jgi:6-hydroxytryprostatin B O-methyltransferase
VAFTGMPSRHAIFLGNVVGILTEHHSTGDRGRFVDVLRVAAQTGAYTPKHDALSNLYTKLDHTRTLSTLAIVTMKKVARDAAIEHATQIKQLVHDPSSFLTELHIQQQQYYSIQWLTHFDVFSQIPTPPHGAPYATVATACKIPEPILRSMARMAMTTGFLCETVEGHLSHNDLSAPFIKDTHLQVQLKHFFGATVPVMAGMIKATEKWGDTRAPSETAYNVANDTDLPFFAHLKAKPDLQKKFEDYMKSRAVSHTGSSAEYLLEAFDWNALGDARVVDVSAQSHARRNVRHLTIA